MEKKKEENDSWIANVQMVKMIIHFSRFKRTCQRMIKKICLFGRNKKFL